MATQAMSGTGFENYALDSFERGSPPGRAMSSYGLIGSGGGGGATIVYTMRAIQDGTATVYWDNDNAPDKTGTGPNAPPGVLTDIGIESVGIET